MINILALITAPCCINAPVIQWRRDERSWTSLWRIRKLSIATSSRLQQHHVGVTSDVLLSVTLLLIPFRRKLLKCLPFTTAATAAAATTTSKPVCSVYYKCICSAISSITLTKCCFRLLRHVWAGSKWIFKHPSLFFSHISRQPRISNVFSPTPSNISSLKLGALTDIYKQNNWARISWLASCFMGLSTWNSASSPSCCINVWNGSFLPQFANDHLWFCHTCRCRDGTSR